MASAASFFAAPPYPPFSSCHPRSARFLLPKRLLRKTKIGPFLSLSTSSSHIPSASKNPINSPNNNNKQKINKEEIVEEEEEVEEDLPWIEEKALDLVEFTGSVTQAIPGPRVGRSSLPWALAVPLAYFAVTFVFAVVKTVQKFSSPMEARRKLVFLLCLK